MRPQAYTRLYALIRGMFWSRFRRVLDCVPRRGNLPMHPQVPAWTFEHSIECPVSFEFAWQFWTDVNNWVLDADVRAIELDGPFAAGARGLTRSRSSCPVEWRIAEVQTGAALIEFPLSGAVGRFLWTFEDTGGHVRITQRVTLEGEQAGTYAATFGPALEAGIPAGMYKLCESIAAARQASLMSGAS